MEDRYIDMNCAQLNKEDTQKYAIYISRSRVTPDYKDGQKPVQRKILYTMQKMGATNHLSKSANIVGMVMGKFHPHGDSGIYGAIKPMVNWFETNIPLIYSESNFGTFQGDPAAAMRYTDIRLSDFAKECMLAELGETEKVVDWIKNFDETEIEPEYLPAKVPILLINGAFGIGSGLKVEIPRHNINEVLDATINLIKNPDCSVVLIPDHSMSCDIIDTNWKQICNKGFGTYKVRGRINIIEYEGYPALEITSMPDLVFLDNIREKINKLIETNELVQIKEEKDLSEEKLRYILILKKGADPEFVKQVIYSKTDLEQSCRINFEVLDGIELLRMSYKSYLQAFIEFRKLTKFRLYCNRLQPVKTRMHQLDAYIKVLSSGHIDEIISMIRKYKGNDKQYVVDFICKKTKITPLQAEFILSRQISQLSIGSLSSYKDEFNKLEEKRVYLTDKIIHEDFNSEIIQELEDIKKKYGNTPRRRIISSAEASDIPQGEFKVIFTQKNFVKKLQLTDAVTVGTGDTAKYAIKGDNTENLIIFDEQGKVFKTPIHKIPFTDRRSAGTDIRMLNKNMTSNINSVMYEPDVKAFAEKKLKYFVVVVTKNGLIKKMDIEDILGATLSGIAYIKLDQGDVVADVMIISSKSDVVVYSDTKALRLKIDDIPHLKRSTKGSKSMNADVIDGLSIITSDTTDIVVITEQGKVNRFSQVAMAPMLRGRKGSNVIKLSGTDKIHSIYGLHQNDSVMVTTEKERIQINVSDIPEGSSISGGQKMINIKEVGHILRTDMVRS